MAEMDFIFSTTRSVVVSSRVRRVILMGFFMSVSSVMIVEDKKGGVDLGGLSPIR